MKQKAKRKTKPQRNRWLQPLLTIVFVIIALGAVTAGVYYAYQSRVLPRVSIGALGLGGKSLVQAQTSVSERTQDIVRSGLTFTYRDQVVKVDAVVSSATDPGLSYELLTFDTAATAREAYDFGHQGAWWVRLKDQWQSIFAGHTVRPHYYLNRAELEKTLALNFGDFEHRAQDATLVVQPGEITVTPEKSGQAFDYQKILNQVQASLEQLKDLPFTLTLEDDEPTIHKDQTAAAVSLAQTVLRGAPDTLVYQDKKWEISQDQLGSWLTFKQDAAGAGVTLGFNQELINFLQAKTPEINSEVQDGKFEIKDGRVSEFQPSQLGRQLQIEKSVEAIEQAFIHEQKHQATLVVEEVVPENLTEKINTYGIRELIGRGTSDFKNSPKNRIHNIGVGAGTLNGILIPPGVEFSLVKALGKIEAATGYLPELVIKGNKTVPEYGGGLCQIGTTTFRVALDAGLPITARTAHSYRVSYYEPAGTDATIYDPQPDFKFINDTGHYILFQTKIEGTELIFEFYGTRDGRKVEMNLPPRIFNVVQPGPTKIIETTDLAPGEKKCTEKAHAGAETEFTRKVTYADGTVKSEVWKSKYVPWQAVCLIGVAPNKETPPVNPPSNENQNTNSNQSTNANGNVNTNTNTNQLSENANQSVNTNQPAEGTNQNNQNTP